MKLVCSAVLLLLIAVTVQANEGADGTPVYRGQYYPFDAYPHGYKGYPAFPYYGAPFGYGGPAFAATEQTTTYGKDETTPRQHVQSRHTRHRRASARQNVQ